MRKGRCQQASQLDLRLSQLVRKREPFALCGSAYQILSEYGYGTEFFALSRENIRILDNRHIFICELPPHLKVEVVRSGSLLDIAKQIFILELLLFHQYKEPPQKREHSRQKR
jgi:hypothetical protein